MHTQVTFKNLDPSEALKNYAAEKLERLDKYLDNPAEANVILTVEKFRHIAEIIITGDRMTITGKEETGDMYSSIDKVMDKLDKQIKKGKQKVRERRGGKDIRREMDQQAYGVSVQDEDGEERFVTIEKIEYKPMDVEEAILQMDLDKNSFLVFTNAQTGQVNVLYQKKDGGMGLIEPAV
jgi:putative sigma-54 modulation protein